MAEGPGHFLNELTIWKLKAVAEEHNIDVSTCKYKRDFVQKIAAKKLTEEQVRSALQKKGGKDKAKDEPSDADIGKDLKSISEAPLQPPELPVDEEKNVERHLDEALMMKPTLIEADSAMEGALNRMILGDYYSAIKMNRAARSKCLENFSKFQVYSSAMSIRAADELFSKLVDEKGELDSILRTALAEAKLAFIDGAPKRREETLENLEVLATKAFDAFLANTEKEEAELRGLLSDYESFGTRTEESRRYLDIASQARQAMNIAEYKKLVEGARSQADKAKDRRAKEIASSFHIVKAAAAEARDLGIDTSSADASMAEAKKAFEQGSFKSAVSLLADIEKQVDDAHLAQLRTRKDLEERQLESIRRSIEAYEPIFKEASSYGVDSKEGTYNIVNARAALARRDAINGVKFGRRIREIGSVTDRELDKKRLETGVIRHLDGVKCAECEQESVYVYPNSSSRCLECGHSVAEVQRAAADQSAAQTVTAEQRAVDEASAAQQDKKKKFGFLRW
jgi:ribosomal protein S27E